METLATTHKHRDAIQCPVCGGSDVEEMFGMADVPVYCNVLYDERGEALSASRANIALVACTSCGHVFNSRFDADRVDYDVQYENSLHFSPRFQQYADALASELVEKYGLRETTVVEVACGKGEFLSLLKKNGAYHAMGFDPSYPTDGSGILDEDVEVVPEYFGPGSGLGDVGLLCCRHALEHVANPRGFLRDVHRSLSADGAVYFEVPNADYMLEKGRAWDVIYEHCGYFTQTSLVEVFRRTGFVVVDVTARFGGQFLSIEARVRHDGRRDVALQNDSGDGVVRKARDFASVFRRQDEYWSKSLEDAKRGGKQVVVWGAGSKGVTFVNVAAGPAVIECLIDLNPRKEGKYIAGTGDVIRAPDALKGINPDMVVVMNENYRAEVDEMLAAMGVHATVVCA